MTIKLATKLAIIGTSIAMVLSLAGSFLLDWIVRIFDMWDVSISILHRVYYSVMYILSDGSLLLFFVTLYSRQKAQAKQP